MRRLSRVSRLVSCPGVHSTCSGGQTARTDCVRFGAVRKRKLAGDIERDCRRQQAAARWAIFRPLVGRTPKCGGSSTAAAQGSSCVPGSSFAAPATGQTADVALESQVFPPVQGLTRSFRSSTIFSTSTCVSSTSFWLGVTATVCWRRGACNTHAMSDPLQVPFRGKPPAARTRTSQPESPKTRVAGRAGRASWIRHVHRAHCTQNIAADTLHELGVVLGMFRWPITATGLEAP